MTYLVCEVGLNKKKKKKKLPFLMIDMGNTIHNSGKTLKYIKVNSSCSSSSSSSSSSFIDI